MPARAIGLRLFLTCWAVYVLHFATDFAREHYLVVSIVEDRSYALDKYYGLHPDIFRNPPEAKVQGVHHGANPGISMVAAIPYLVFKPLVDRIVNRELAARQARGEDEAPVYRDPRTARVKFYQSVRQRGLDVRFGLVGLITLLFCMAPLTAGSAVLMFGLLERLGVTRRVSLGLALLYAFGTPVFFRTAYLNQNLALGVFTFAAFLLVWNPRDWSGWSVRSRYILAGLLGGLAFLTDYSGFIPMAVLAGYAWWRASDEQGATQGLRTALWYGVGAVGPVLLLWHYQWASFGDPFLPPQHWMPPVEFIEIGYQGVGGLSPDLIRLLLFSPRFGLLATTPLLVLAPFGVWRARRAGPVPFREALVCLTVGVGLILFFGTVQYTRIQHIAGIRYLMPTIPFLFLAAVPALLRLPRLVVAAVALGSFLIGWSLAMVRSQGTVLDNVTRAAIEGLQLPWLSSVSKASAQYMPWLTGRPSPTLLFLALGAVLWIIWRLDAPFRRLGARQP